MKKILSLILALVMVALPLFGMAATPEELMKKGATSGRALDAVLSFDASALTGDDTVTAAIRDLLNALSIRNVTAVDGGYTQFQLLLGGKAVLANEMTMGDGKIAVKNNFFGDAPLTLAKEDVRALFERISNLTASTEGGAAIPNLNELVLSVESALSVTPANAVAAAEKLEAQGAAFLKAGEELFANGEAVDAVDTAGEFVPVAGGKKINLTADLCKKFLADAMQAAGANADALGNVGQVIDQLFADVETATATLYATADNVPVFMDVQVELKADAKSVEQMNGLTDVELRMGRGTAENSEAVKVFAVFSSKQHPGQTFRGKALFTPGETKSTFEGELKFVTENEETPVMNVMATKDKNYGDAETVEHIAGTVDVLPDGKEETKATFTFQADTKTTFDGKDAASDSVVTLSIHAPARENTPEMKVDGLKILASVKTVDVPSMDMANATDVGKMDESQLQSLVSSLSMTAMGVLGNIVQSLPASVTRMLMPIDNQ